MVDILLNSALFYQKKYSGEMEVMEEVFKINDSIHENTVNQ